MEISKLYPSMTDVVTFENKIYNTAGYVGWESSTNSIIIAFRGTMPLSLRNWLQDMNTLTKKHPGCTNCKVHLGFYDNYLSLREKFWDAFNYLKYKYGKSVKNIYVTGHSLGGAIA